MLCTYKNGNFFETSYWHFDDLVGQKQYRVIFFDDDGDLDDAPGNDINNTFYSVEAAKNYAKKVAQEINNRIDFEDYMFQIVEVIDSAKPKQTKEFTLNF